MSLAGWPSLLVLADSRLTETAQVFAGFDKPALS